MIKEFVKAWDANKSLLEEHIKTQDQADFDYALLLKMLIDIVINPYIDGKLDSANIHVINDGDYQGSQLFIVPANIYQPEPKDYIWTYQDYGSCSGCDLLESIREYDGGLPTEKQVKEYMILELHLLQRCRYMIGRETYIGDIKKEQFEKIENYQEEGWYSNSKDEEFIYGISFDEPIKLPVEFYVKKK